MSVTDLVTGVDIALGVLPIDACPSLDAPGNGVVSVDELIAAVGNALYGCS